MKDVVKRIFEVLGVHLQLGGVDPLQNLHPHTGRDDPAPVSAGVWFRVFRGFLISQVIVLMVREDGVMVFGSPEEEKLPRRVGIWFNITGTRTVGYGKLETGEE